MRAWRKKINISKTTQRSLLVACSCITSRDTMATAEVRDDGETTELENPPASLKSPVWQHFAFPVSCVNNECFVDRKATVCKLCYTLRQSWKYIDRFELPKSLTHKWNVLKTQSMPLSYSNKVDNELVSMYSRLWDESYLSNLSYLKSATLKLSFLEFFVFYSLFPIDWGNKLLLWP